MNVLRLAIVSAATFSSAVLGAQTLIQVSFPPMADLGLGPTRSQLQETAAGASQLQPAASLQTGTSTQTNVVGAQLNQLSGNATLTLR